MANILFVYEMNSPSAELTKQVYDAYRRIYGGVEFRYRKDSEVKSKDFKWCDIVLIVRGLSPFEAALCKKAKKHKKLCILHLDDNMLAPPEDYLMLKARKKSVAYNVKNAELVVTNPFLVEKFLKINIAQRCITTEIIVEEDKIYPHRAGNEKVKIVYAASKNHEIFFEKYIAPALGAIYDSCGNVFTLTFIGNDPDTKDFDRKIEVEKVPQMSMDRFLDYMSEQNFDIGLAPIDDNEFCHGKYYNKYLNYAQFGITGLYTNCPPYTYVIDDGVNGVLCRAEADDWGRKLIEVIRDASLRARIQENELKDLRENFSPEKIAERLARDIPELKLVAKRRCEKRKTLIFSKIRYRIFILKERSYFFLVNLKKIGIIKTFQKIVAHFKSLKNYGNIKD